jgi:hypothetical protein
MRGGQWALRNGHLRSTAVRQGVPTCSAVKVKNGKKMMLSLASGTKQLVKPNKANTTPDSEGKVKELVPCKGKRVDNT